MSETSVVSLRLSNTSGFSEFDLARGGLANWTLQLTAPAAERQYVRQTEMMRQRLQQADTLVRQGRIAEAVSLYELVAGEFENTGFALKAIAVSRQIVDLAENGSELSAGRAAALRRLARLYAHLGLGTDAAEAERLLQSSPRGRLQ